MVQYGGDEVSALVLDIGTSSTRAGYAGDDTPKAIIPTTYGFVRDGGPDAPMDGTDAPSTKMYVGQHGPSVWRANMEIGNPMQDGMIADWKPIPALIGHALRDVLRVNPEEHPVLVTEPAWNTPENRERMAELMFEEFHVPAFYIANTGVLNAFAAGKGSALVVDIGRSTASVTPVVDGFVLRKGLAHSGLPQLVHAQARNILQGAAGGPIRLLSHQLIASKTPVEPRAAPIFTLREDRLAQTPASLLRHYESIAADEWLQSVAGVLDQGWNEQAAASRPLKQHEFATGFNTYFAGERFAAGELLFSHTRELAAANPQLPHTLPALLSRALAATDQDMRGVLLTNIVLTGGGSMLAGVGERLLTELQRNVPHVKIHAPGNPTERRYGGWLGGSILASLGTFHQLWISREEWQEHGKSIVGQRCK
ncbi:actin family [Vararia minispora EC-137]|uniref:Actin family n=1 Tax=Vararia minispora EC-137 TaxID=1314806 RepID=A0ACB8QV70_9AGAM|nr:actin family [Vararia minispora EC-137]